MGLEDMAKGETGNQNGERETSMQIGPGDQKGKQEERGGLLPLGRPEQ